jgi:hypothetical protein
MPDACLSHNALYWSWSSRYVLLVSDLFSASDITSMCISVTVLGIAELCLAIASYTFDPDDVLSAGDIYSLRLASRSFSRGIIDVVVLRSISVRWNPPIPPGFCKGTSRPKDSRPQFDGKHFAAGLLLSDMTEWCLVKEVLVSTGETFDHDERYPFAGNRHFLAEVVGRLRSGVVDVNFHPLRLIICTTSYWHWAMISGLTQALEGIQAIHIELRAPYYFPVLQDLDAPSLHLHPIVDDTNPHRVNTSLDSLPRFLCDTLVLNQPRYDSELHIVLQDAPERLRNLVVKLVVGANVGANQAPPRPLPPILAPLSAIKTFTWEVDTDGPRPNNRKLAGRIRLLIDILSRFPPDNQLRYLHLSILLGAPFDDRSACVQLHQTVGMALRLLAERLASEMLEKVLLSVHIALRPGSNFERTDRATDFTPDGLRLPGYRFRPDKERTAAEFERLKSGLAAAMRPVGREFLWSVASSEKSDTCTSKRERYWELKDHILPWNIDTLFPSVTAQSTGEVSALAPRYYVVRTFTDRQLPVQAK